MSGDDNFIQREVKVYLSKNDFVGAIELIKGEINNIDNSPEMLFLLGSLHAKVNDTNEAMKCFKKVAYLTPGNLKNKFLLAKIYMEVKQQAEAIALFNDLLRFADYKAVSLLNLGHIFRELKEFEKSNHFFILYLDLHPSSEDVLYIIGNNLTKISLYERAVNYFNKALQLGYESFQIYNDLGFCLWKLGELQISIYYLEKAKYLNQESSLILNNLANVLSDRGQYNEAIECFKSAITISAEDHLAKYNLSLVQLANKDFVEGWKNYEARWQALESIGTPFNTSKNLWKGESGLRLIIWPEQGIGDTVMFASLLPILSSKCENLTVMVEKRLLNIFRASFSTDFKLCCRTENLSESCYDAHLPMGSIAHVLNKAFNYSDFNPKPYLKPPKKEFKPLNEHPFASTASKFIGISWRTTASVKGARDRNFDLYELVINLKSEDVVFVCLQYGDVEQEIEDVVALTGAKIIHFKDIDFLLDLDAFAFLLSSCHQVVTIDNSTVHFAGAIGVETLLLLPYASNWRWGISDEKSYWYSSVKIVRQSEVGNWSSVIEHIRANIFLS